MDSLIGHSKQEIIMAAGPPQRIETDGGTGEILVYAKQFRRGGNSNYSDTGTSTTTITNVYYKYTMFYVNKMGKVYYWRISTEYVPPSQIDLTVYHRQ